MQELKKLIETNIGTINGQIVETQRVIDETFSKYLDNPLNVEVKVLRETKEQDKFFYYGWLGALESILAKINELEEKDELEFELALDQLEVTERELKAECPF